MLYILNMEQKKINMEQAWNNYKEGEENEAVNEIRRTERRTGDG